MDQKSPTTRSSFRLFTNLAGGCLFFLFLILGAAMFALNPIQYIRDKSATPTPIITQIPRILAHEPDDKTKVINVIKEDFSSNKREWGLFYPNGKLEIINGKLILQSNLEQRYVIGRSREFDFLNEKYYVQADFTTDVDNGYSYGLVFGISDSLGTYYMFEVVPRTGYFRLLKYNNGKWDELVPLTYSVLKPYSEENTLSIYFDAGDIELFINGNLVSSFSDNNFFQSKGIGVFVQSTGYRLIVDNFFAYDEK